MTSTLPNSVLVLVTAVLAVFFQGSFDVVRRLTGAQLDLLPSLMVYASLCTGLETLVAAALVGGLCFDALSSNPLGISILPLFTVGLIIHAKRELILRDQLFAQFMLGLGAGIAVPVLTLLLLLTTGHTPLLGLGSLWQWMVMGLGGAITTPILFWLFSRLLRALIHNGDLQSSFRPDREIRRGRI